MILVNFRFFVLRRFFHDFLKKIKIFTLGVFFLKVFCVFQEHGWRQFRDGQAGGVEAQNAYTGIKTCQAKKTFESTRDMSTHVLVGANLSR